MNNELLNFHNCTGFSRIIQSNHKNQANHSSDNNVVLFGTLTLPFFVGTKVGGQFTFSEFIAKKYLSAFAFYPFSKTRKMLYIFENQHFSIEFFTELNVYYFLAPLSILPIKVFLSLENQVFMRNIEERFGARHSIVLFFVNS